MQLRWGWLLETLIMINLIPNQEKKRKVKDFYFRLGVVFLVTMAVCILINLVAILPAYFLSSVKKNLVEEKLATQKSDPIPITDQNTLATITDLKSKLDLIEKAEQGKYLVSTSVINEVLLKKMPDIKITEISYNYNSTNGKKVSISGIAPSRERLLLFRNALQEDVAFKKVDLPISNFIKGSDIEFSLTLIPS